MQSKEEKRRETESRHGHLGERLKFWFKTLSGEVMHCQT